MTKHSFSILVVDDDPDDRYMMHHAFQQAGWTDNLKLYENGMDLIRHLELLPDTYCPALIVLDKNMPVIDGVELLQYLRKNKQFNNVPVAVYSCFMTPALKQQLLSYGATACYQKPKGINENVTLVKNLCNLIQSTDVATPVNFT